MRRGDKGMKTRKISIQYIYTVIYMKDIEGSTEETFQNISGMNRELSAYRIEP